MKTSPPFHMLVVSSCNSLANQLIAALRKDHIAIRATGVSNATTFTQHLQEEPADLVLLVESDVIIPEHWLELYAKTPGSPALIIACSKKFSREKAHATKALDHEVIPASNITALSQSIKKQALYCREKMNNRMMANRIREMERQHRLLLDSCQDALAILCKGQHRYCNDRYVALFSRLDNSASSALDRKKLLHCSMQDLLTEADRQALARILNSETSASTTLQVCSKAASQKLSLGFSPIIFNNENCLQVTVKPARGNTTYSRDKQTLATQDLLTRLKNEEIFTDKVEAAIARAIGQQQLCSLMIVQIDAFQEMQATIGKSGTNQLLYEISEFLNKAISKPFVASRMAENEFGLLLYDSSAEQGVTLANYIHRRLNSAFSGGDNPMAISASLGLTFINELALDAQDMINRARINRNLPLTYAAGDAACHTHNTVIVDLIRKSLDSGKWHCRFQPLLCFTPDSLSRYEVLFYPEGQAGEVSSEELLAHANIHNLAGEIDKEVLNLLLSQQDIQKDSSKLLFIPVSGNTLVNKSMLTWLSTSLQRYKGSADKLVFLISEIDLHGNSQLARAFCTNLGELGIGIGISRFGSAMEPLALVTTIKPHFVMLDQSLYSEILYSKKQQQSVRKLISALHHEQVSVGISGIKEIESLPLLWELGVDLIQGNCLGQPGKSMEYAFPQENIITLCA